MDQVSGDKGLLPAWPVSADALASVLDVLKILAVVTDADRRIRYLNPAAEAFYGYPAADAVGQRLGDLLHPTFNRITAERVMTALEQTGRISVRVEHEKKNHQRALVVATLIRLPGQNSRPAGYLLLGRPESPALVRRHMPPDQPASAPMTGEPRFQALVMASSEVLFRMSPDWSEMWDLDSRGSLTVSDEPIHDWMERFVPAEDRANLRAAIDDAIGTRSVFHLKHRAVREDGTVGWLDSRAVPLIDADGQITEWFGAASDVTDTYLHQAAVQETHRLTEFLATLAHELRNPLAAIQLSIDLLEKRGVSREAGQGVWDVLERQVGHLTQLVHGLLDVARVNQGTIELNKAPVALRDIVEHALDITQPRMYHSGITLRMTAPQEPVFVDGDRVRLAQVLANLIDNAYKFTEPGGEVSILAETADGWLSLAVRDTGVGIPPDGLPAVFDMFWRGQSAGSGLGLGLTLVRHLVELHGGRVEAFSPGPGQGSTFVIHLPLRPAEPAAATEARTASRAVGRHRVLVVDDNADLVDVLSSLLRDLGATVTATRDGREVVALARQFCPSVILLDIGMAPVDGYELARRIRQDSAFDGVALVAITGWGGVEDVERMHAAGFQHHVLKPVTLHELETLLAAIPTPDTEDLLSEG